MKMAVGWGKAVKIGTTPVSRLAVSGGTSVMLNAGATGTGTSPFMFIIVDYGLL